MSKLLELLVSLSAAGSTVVICILLLRLISPGAFPPKWRYAIGKMAIGFYLLPIALVLQWLFPLFVPKQTTTVPISGLPSSVQLTQSDLTIAAIPELNLSADVALVFLSIWGTGAFAFAIWQIYCYRRFIKKLQQTRSPVPENSEAAKQLALIKEAFGMQSNVQLAYSSAIRSPILVGLWQPAIYLPMENAANVDMGMVIRHELIHLKRKDLWVKAIALAASALHWFNPFVHVLRKDIHTWSELSCDEEVVKEMSYAERKRYGETILNVMTGSRSIPTRFCASLSSDGKQLKRRLTIMLTVKKLKKHTIMMSAAAVIAVGAIGTSTAAWAAAITPKVNADTNQTIEGAGDSILYEGVQFLKYSALTPDEQKFVTEKGLGGIYALKGYEHPVPIDELTPDEQRQVTIEDGYYSPASIARVKESYEKHPPGASVTITHQEDPSIPPGTSMTIRSLTPEESAVLKKMEEKARSAGGSRKLAPEEIAELKALSPGSGNTQK
ncbi:M56 family metallopeptidase [Brevibacillus borstelensis]|uniref:M56 family metallopeptidase n=1 Tax=Brevibacillus borstelensis TaxID=45462 RepID=UPI0030C2C20D